jgi:hypothetical protein
MRRRPRPPTLKRPEEDHPMQRVMLKSKITAQVT